MCDRNSVLIVFLILKIIILVIVPIIVYILYKRENKLFNFVSIVNILFIIALIIMRLTSNECVTNSNFSYLRNNGEEKYIEENPNSAEYESVYSTEQYLTNDSKNVYQYNINEDPLKNVSLSCDKKSYLKNYGNGLAAITSLISNYSETDLNIIEFLDMLEENKLIDCNNGFDFNSAFIKSADYYSLNVKQISASEIDNYLSTGHSVLAETINKVDEDKNFGCEKDYIVIYNSNGDEYSILNPNDKTYSYFCPSNTIGYGSIIEGNQNDKAFTLNEINSKALRYFVVEVR